MVAVYAAAIFIQSSLPSPIKETHLPGQDKLLHFAAYALMAVLICRALAASSAPRRTALRLALTAVLLSSLYGASDEFHQALVAGRSAEVLDWIADVAGSLAGAMAWAGHRLWQSRT